MTKYKKNKKLKLITFGIITGFLGIVASGAIINNNNVVVVKADTNSITITDINTLMETIKNNRENILEENNNFSLSGTITYNTNQTLNVQGVNTTTINSYSFLENPEDMESDLIEAMYYNNEWVYLHIEQQITINNMIVNQTGTNETLYNLLQTPPQPTATDIGTGIISAIRSGLGLITSLATEFMLGFSTLFWNSTTSTLTTFGIFALIMLGVSISFAVIKIVLNILRNNTGA